MGPPLFPLQPMWRAFCSTRPLIKLRISTLGVSFARNFVPHPHPRTGGTVQDIGKKETAVLQKERRRVYSCCRTNHEEG